jgi:nitrite reductase (NADH) small subunit
MSQEPTMTALTVTVRVCELDDIATGLGRAFEVGGQSIAVFRGRTGQVFAVSGVCPHKAGPLADGMLIGEQVVCPLHAFRFHATSGECDQMNVCRIETYQAVVRDGAVFVTVPVG